MSTLQDLAVMILKGDSERALPALRAQVAEQADGDEPMGSTPEVHFDSSEDKSDPLYLLCLCCWEFIGNEDFDADVRLVEKAVSKRKQISFRLALTWLSLKCNPHATRDQLHDGQQLLERYMGQLRKAVESGQVPRDQDLRDMYTEVTEILAVRVFCGLGLYESALSLILQENVPEELMDQQRRAEIEYQVRLLTPSSCANQTRPPTTTETPVPTGGPESDQVANQQPHLDSSSIVREFHALKEQERQQQTRAIATGVLAACVLLFVASQRRQVSRVVSTVADALFSST